MNTQKGFVKILIVILALALISGGVYYFKNKNNAAVPANWKMYTDPATGLEFQYPDDPAYMVEVDPTHGTCGIDDVTTPNEEELKIANIPARHITCNDARKTEWLTFKYKDHDFYIKYLGIYAENPAVFNEIAGTFKLK
jgi:hypothetical protein